ncbi:MAG: hypothetical protein C5B58_07435 [Acidobacteria bacterium]|nr:MAG: hypothetical protein C5B58_07435 [Acidobacteriota bacterium]
MCLLLAPQNVSALARYECRGITADKIILTPYQDGSVNLSFNDGDVTETTKFSHKGDVFTAIFKNVTGGRSSLLIFIIDTITRNGYEVFDLPQGSGSVKITCWWYQN